MSGLHGTQVAVADVRNITGYDRNEESFGVHS